jgi:hypothetical protein
MGDDPVVLVLVDQHAIARTLAWTIRSGNVIAIPESGLAAHVKENAVALSLTRTHTGSKCGEIGKSAKNGKKEYEAAKKAQDEIGEKVAGGMRDAIARHTRNQRHREACSPVRWEREVDLDSQTDQHRDGQEHNNPR